MTVPLPLCVSCIWACARQQAMAPSTRRAARESVFRKSRSLPYPPRLSLRAAPGPSSHRTRNSSRLASSSTTTLLLSAAALPIVAAVAATAAALPPLAKHLFPKLLHAEGRDPTGVSPSLELPPAACQPRPPHRQPYWLAPGSDI